MINNYSLYDNCIPYIRLNKVKEGDIRLMIGLQVDNSNYTVITYVFKTGNMYAEIFENGVNTFYYGWEHTL